MDRQTARSARKLVAEEPTVVGRTGSIVARVAIIAFLALLIYLVLIVATGKASPAGEINPAKATDPVKSSGKTFITPSGRFACVTEQFAPSPTWHLDCELRAIDGTGPPSPKVQGESITKVCKREAPDEWGRALSLSTKGKASASCPTGVTVVDRHPPVFAYNTRWKLHGFVCLSRSDALRCSNGTGSHGFRLNKDVLRVY